MMMELEMGDNWKNGFCSMFGVLFMRKHGQKQSGSYLTYWNDQRKHAYI
jgi:hypothetical protein